MDANRDFIQTLNQYYDGELDCNSIIIPNSFGIRKVDSNEIIAKIGNKEFRTTTKICMNFTLIGDYVWNCLAQRRKYLDYAIVGYIANSIKFNSNIVRINADIIKGIVGAELSNRNYQESMADLKRYSIIRDISVRGMFEVNPLAIFKGNIYQLINIWEEKHIKGYFDDGDKVILDKFAVVKDKMGEDVRVILNRKYYKEEKSKKEKVNMDKLKGLTFDFSKKVK